jgi:endonuclease/exonuclease/phosphatase family metal-dependent hydrolase
VDHLPEDVAGGNSWNDRKQFCIETIRSRNPDVICAQEVLRSQMEDLKKALPEFGSYGFDGPEMDAREEGYQGIAKNPIFYSLKRYELVTAGGFWLSETPHIPASISWDSARARHVNWVRLKDRETGRQFRVMDLHLDNVNSHAREEQIKLVLAEAAAYPAEFLLIIAGDFNSRGGSPVHELIRQAGWKDCHMEAPGPRDDGNTGHGFKSDEGKAQKGPIDFIYARGNTAVRKWEIIRDSKDGHYPSDHYFVMTEVGF